MKTSNFKDLLEQSNIKTDTMSESKLKRASNYHNYSRISEICSDKGFVNIDFGSQGENHWTCFKIKDKKSI